MYLKFRMGSVLSPILFSVYIDELLLRLKDCGVGCYNGTIFFGAVAHADDIALLCPNLSGMSKMFMMLKVAKDYSDEFNIVFNAGKNLIIPFGNSSRDSNLIIGETVIRCNLNGIHSGHWLGMVDTENGISNSVKYMHQRTSCMVTKFDKAGPCVNYKLFKCYCVSLYGC